MSKKKQYSQNKQSKSQRIDADGFFSLSQAINTRPTSDTGFNFTLKPDALLAGLYAGNGLAKRYIDILVDDLTREWISITNDTEDQAITYLKNLKSKIAFKEACINAKLFGGALIFMVIDDGGTPQDPVNINKIKSIKKLKVFSKTQVTIEDYNYYQDPSNINYGEPEYFTINSYGVPTKIHESRCLIVQGDYFPYDECYYSGGITSKYWGVSILQSCYQEFQNFNLAYSSLAHTLTKFNIDVLQLTGLFDKLKSDAGRAELKARVDLLNLSKSISNTLLTDENEGFKTVSQSLSGVSDVFSKLQQALSASLGIPETLLWGKSPGSLNATADNEIRMYYDKIKADQEQFLLPPLERLLTYVIAAQDNQLSNTIEYKIKFQSLWQLTEQEITTLRKTQAEADQIYVNLGALDPTEIRQSRFGGSDYSLHTTITMGKKYKLIESNIEGLYRIQALRDFGDVKKGDIIDPDLDDKLGDDLDSDNDNQ